VGWGGGHYGYGKELQLQTNSPSLFCPKAWQQIGCQAPGSVSAAGHHHHRQPQKGAS